MASHSLVGRQCSPGCRETATTSETAKFVPFTPDEIAYLDEIADTILPDTKTPGAKAAKTGAFMALMVTDSYGADDQKIFRDGMKALDDASRKANNVTFVAATPAQRLALLESLDKEQKTHSDARDAAKRKAKSVMRTFPINARKTRRRPRTSAPHRQSRRIHRRTTSA